MHLRTARRSADKFLMSKQLRLIAQDILSARPKIDVSLPTPSHSIEELRAFGFRLCHWVVDVCHMTVSHIGRDFEAIFHLSPDVMDTDPAGFMERVHPEDRETLLGNIQMSADRSIDVRVRLLNGKDLKWIWLRSFPLENDDLFSSPKVLFVAEDITSTMNRELKRG